MWGYSRPRSIFFSWKFLNVYSTYWLIIFALLANEGRIFKDTHPWPNSSNLCKQSLEYCQTPDLDQDFSLGVDFVFPLEQQQQEEEEEPPTKIYRKDVKHMSKIWHISWTHKNKIKWQLPSQHLSMQLLSLRQTYFFKTKISNQKNFWSTKKILVRKKY